jgi:CBS domain-containing protein
MFCDQLISSEITPVNLNYRVEQTLHLMDEYHIRQIPVIDGDAFLGMVSEDDLLDVDSDKRIVEVIHKLIGFKVKTTDFFLMAVKLAYLYDLDIVPVVNDKLVLEGVVTKQTLFKHLAEMSGAGSNGATVLLEMEQIDFNPPLFNRLVESNDAFITHLNSWSDTGTNRLHVLIQINKQEVSDILATFQRYDFNVRHFAGEELYTNELQTNFNQLMHYLNM